MRLKLDSVILLLYCTSAREVRSYITMVLMSFWCQVVVEGERRDGSNGQYDQICNARLPRALDPHSVPSEELSASLG